MQLESAAGYARITLGSPLAGGRIGPLILRAVSDAEAQGIRRLLVDLRGADSAQTPSTAECYELGAALARAGAHVRRVALLLPGRIVPPHEFTATVAANRGLQTGVFCTLGEAMSWLLCGA